MDTDDLHILTLLGHHLLLLYGADAVLRVEYHNSGTRHIGEACHSCLAGIAGGSGQDHDLIFHLILLRGNGHQMGQDGERHILERDGGTMEQLQEISAVRLHKRRDLRRIKLLVVSAVDAVLQLLLCKIRQELAHNRVSCLLIAHLCQLIQTYIQCRNLHRHKQTAVRGKAL